MEWTKTKQINEEDLFAGQRLWVFNLIMSYRYRKTQQFLYPAEVFIEQMRGYQISLRSPFTSISAFGGRESYLLPSWNINNTAGLFNTEEDAITCWNEALDSCIKELEGIVRSMKHEYISGSKEYQLTAGKDLSKEFWEETPEKDIFKNSTGKYFVSYTSPFRHQVGLVVPNYIRFTSRGMGGGSYPIYLGPGQIIWGEDCPKTMGTMFFPSKSDVALYYSNIGKYEVCKSIDEWAEKSINNIEGFKIK